MVKGEREKEMVGRKVKWGALGGLDIGPGEGSENNVKDVGKHCMGNDFISFTSKSDAYK